jgi:hypothetical protein
VRVYAGEGPARSPTLGAYLVVTEGGRHLRLADDERATTLWPTAEESERAAKERALAATAEERAATAKERAATAKERAAKERALARVAELEAALAARAKGD